MKTQYLYLFAFLLLLNCDLFNKKESKENPTTETTTESVEETMTNEEASATEEIVEEETVKEVPVKTESELVVVLNDANKIADIKELIKNSGLKWDKLLLDTEADKIAVVKVPIEKTDFWINRLGTSEEFKEVALSDAETVTKIIDNIKNTLVRLRKTPCFGDCPIYEMTIDKEGNVVFNGIKFVPEVGKKTFVLTEEELKTISEKLNSKDFSTYEKIYDNPKIMDLPSTYIAHNGKQVQIRVWKDAPATLIDLHEYLEGILLAKKIIE